MFFQSGVKASQTTRALNRDEYTETWKFDGAYRKIKRHWRSYRKYLSIFINIKPFENICAFVPNNKTRRYFEEIFKSTWENLRKNVSVNIFVSDLQISKLLHFCKVDGFSPFFSVTVISRTSEKVTFYLIKCSRNLSENAFLMMSDT